MTTELTTSTTDTLLTSPLLGDDDDVGGTNNNNVFVVSMDQEIGEDNDGDDDSQKNLESNLSKGTVGLLGGISIAVNTLTGPGMLDLPATYQRSGFIPTTFAVVLISILSSLCALNMSNVISKIPNNANFTKQVEYSEAFKLLWNHRWFIGTQVAFFMCILCQLIASIVDTAQVVDQFMGSWGNTNAIAIQFYPGPVKLATWNSLDACHNNNNTTTNDDDGACIAFGRSSDGSIILTGGYILSAILFLPLGLMDLKENVIWQVFGFVLLVGFSLQFIITFCVNGLHTENLTMWGGDNDSWKQLFGIIMFNFTVVTAVPAWLSEKKHHTSVPLVIHSSSVLSSTLYVLVGALGALSMPHVSDNMLSTMVAGHLGKGMQVGAFLFAFFIIGLGIPLFSVLMRLNLVGSGLCSTRAGNVLAVGFPWIISWMLYQGQAIRDLLSWGGVLFISFVAFLAPLLIALRTVMKTGGGDADSNVGSVNVWAGCIRGPRRSKKEKVALLCLLLVAVVLVVVSIAGLCTS